MLQIDNRVREIGEKHPRPAAYFPVDHSKFAATDSIDVAGARGLGRRHDPICWVKQHGGGCGPPAIRQEAPVALRRAGWPAFHVLA